MNTVIYHSADYDGIFCREVAKKYLPKDTTFIGWDYGNPLLDFPLHGVVYVLDLSPDCFKQLQLGGPETERLIWIDHHKSAIEKVSNYIKGHRIDGVAACRLAYQWFDAYENPKAPFYFPSKQDFLDRKVNEPFALTLAGEYDVWDHRGDGDIEFQFGLDTLTEINFDLLLSEFSNTSYSLSKIIESGSAAMQCYAKRDADIMKARSFSIKWEGLNFIALNTARCNSNTFLAGIKAEHDGCLAFYYNGKDWNFSLYHVPHKKDIDLSLIAVKYGGGGHKGACGFRTTKIPWL